VSNDDFLDGVQQLYPPKSVSGQHLVVLGEENNIGMQKGRFWWIC
jgi:hypothetical protein